MAGSISQRITLEGSEDVRKKLEELGKTGEAAFKKLRESAQQGIIDPAQINAARQSLAELGTTAEQTGTSLASAAKAFVVSAVGIVTAISAVTSALRKGAGETAIQITEQADALGLTIAQWIGLRRAIDAAGASVEEFVHATGPLLRNINQLSAEFSGRSFQKFADGAAVTTLQFAKLSEQSAQFLKLLEKFGVRRDIVDKGSVAILNELARIIDGMPEGTAKATAGLQFFGAKWRDVVSSLTIGFKSVGDAEAEMDNKRRASRELTEEQVKSSKAAADQWEDLGKAIRAAKDLIGALLAGGSFKKASWLTNLVDDSRELFKTWQGLDEIGKKAFLAGLGKTDAEVVFKTLLKVGQTLAALWDDVLVPAGDKLVEIVKNLAGGLDEVSTSDVVGFLVTAAAAAITLSLALKGIALLLTPLTLLGALFTPLGLAFVAAAAAATLFWDQIKAGAETVARLIPQELEQMQAAFTKLFKGDFAGFWDDFSAAAVRAFETIAAAAQKTPWVKTLVDGVKQIAEDLPGAIVLVVKAFIALGVAATAVADSINLIFGTKLTGTDIALLTIVAGLLGVLVPLAAAAAAAVSIFATFAGVIGGFVAALVSIPAAVGTIIVALAALVAALVAINWDTIKATAVAAWQAITDAVDEVIAKIGDLSSAAGGAIWDSFKSAGEAAINFVIGLFDSLIAKIQGVGAAIRGIVAGGGTPGETTPIPGNARGGLLGGRGTGTSDSNLAWVSRGEHIMPAYAVRQPGVLAFLEALRRSGGNLGHVLDGMGRFASGGLVPRYAAGGLAGSMGHLGTVDLRTDHGSVTLMASGSAMDQLSRLAVTKRMTSTGRKPGFIG